MQRRLCQQVRGHRRGDEKEQRDQQLAQRPLVVRPMPQHAGQQHAAHAQRAGLGGRVQPHEEVVQPHQADRADQQEQRADEQQRGDGRFHHGM
jgi:hypothetical protein